MLGDLIAVLPPIDSETSHLRRDQTGESVHERHAREICPARRRFAVLLYRKRSPGIVLGAG